MKTIKTLSGNYLKKFLKMFPGVNLLRIVAGSVFVFVICFNSSANRLLLLLADGCVNSLSPFLVPVAFTKSTTLDALRGIDGCSFILSSARALPPITGRFVGIFCGGAMVAKLLTLLNFDFTSSSTAGLCNIIG